MKYDVVVVGGRCSGAATAMLLARRGFKVLIVERGRYGSDTLSTHAIVRGGVLQLARWGVVDELRDELSLRLFEITDAVASLAWDLDEVQRLHLAMSREMNDEVEFILGWDEASDDSVDLSSMHRAS